MNSFLTKLGNWIRNILPLDNPPKVMVILGLFMLVMIICFLFHARAFGAELAAAPDEEAYIQLSGGRAVLRGPTSALNLALALPSPVRGDLIQASLTLIGHSEFGGVEYANNYAFSLQYVAGFRQFDIGIGPSWMQNPRPYNGSNVNFNLMAGYRFKGLPVTVWWNHFSCGGACWPNYGRDLALFGYRFK